MDIPPSLCNEDALRLSPFREDVKNGLTLSMQKKTVDDVRESVERDFCLHCRVTDTDQFLDSLFPIDSRPIEDVFNDLVAKKLYKDNRWVDLAAGGRGKEALYGAFVKIANEILNASVRLMRDKDLHSDRLSSMRWVDYHSKSPVSEDDYEASIRPDCILALDAMHEEIKASGHEHLVWWLQVGVLAELKPSESQSWQSVVKQLVGHLRRTLREQKDRRFVFGFTLSPSRIGVWMHDRSGVLGTKTTIDLHENPRKFIHIIAALAVLPADKLGFDPTMEIFIPDGVAIPSYRLSGELLRTYLGDPYATKWITCNSKKYLTVKALTIAHAGIMRGRGMMAWVVIEFPGSPKSREAFWVLKQSWRPVDVEGEGELYEEVTEGLSADPEFVGRLYHWEDVTIDGHRDETGALIRQGLSPELPSILQSVDKRLRPQEQEPFLHVECTEKAEAMVFSIIHRRGEKPVSRIHTRILLSTYGWRLRYFSTLKELVQALHDAIEGHKKLYLEGILHRDISPGNILITWPNFRGCLIDLDRAKKGRYIGMCSFPPPHLTVSPLAPKDALVASVMAMELNCGVIQKDIASNALSVTGSLASAIAYGKAVILHQLQYQNLPLKNDDEPPKYIWSAEALNWKRIFQDHSFDFMANELQRGSRTGTPPYISGEILSLLSYSGHHAVYHDAVHDLESFFWVLLHICLTRNGPGGQRRDELKEINQDGQPNRTNEKLRHIIWCFFDSDSTTEIARNKTVLFRTPMDLKPYILYNIHPYFAPLLPFIAEWYSLLQLAYYHRAFEYYLIHERVQDILQKALHLLGSGTVQNDANAEGVLHIRQDDIKKITEFKSNTGCLQ